MYIKFVRENVGSVLDCVTLLVRLVVHHEAVIWSEM